MSICEHAYRNHIKKITYLLAIKLENIYKKKKNVLNKLYQYHTVWKFCIRYKYGMKVYQYFILWPVKNLKFYRHVTAHTLDHRRRTVQAFVFGDRDPNVDGFSRVSNIVVGRSCPLAEGW